tara:strand:- start:1370 stop:2059 length:690 start_codon:yes stop_codon:yes gene_type:complete
MGPADGPSQGFVTEENHQNRKRDGAVESSETTNQPLKLLGLGDSVIAGVGLASTELTVTARLADRLNQYLGRAIDWRILGEDGAKISDTQRLLAATESGSFDWIVVSVGVNDVTGLTSLVRWQQGLLGLISEIRSRSSHATVVFLQLPPMGRFEMIPQPLRAVLGIRAAMLRQVLTWIVEAHRGVWMIDPSRLFDPAYMAEDGYHPNETAVDWIASEICETVNVTESAS